jgi:hypothetical protein
VLALLLREHRGGLRRAPLLILQCGAALCERYVRHARALGGGDAVALSDGRCVLRRRELRGRFARGRNGARGGGALAGDLRLVAPAQGVGLLCRPRVLGALLLDAARIGLVHDAHPLGLAVQRRELRVHELHARPVALVGVRSQGLPCREAREARRPLAGGARLGGGSALGRVCAEEGALALPRRRGANGVRVVDGSRR